MANFHITKIKKKILLCDPKEGKKSYLITFSNDENIQYNPGDCIAIKPKNDKTHVGKIISLLNANPQYLIKTSNITLEEYLLSHVNISKPTIALVELLYNNQEDEKKKENIKQLLSNTSLLKKHTLIELLEENKIEISIEEFIKTLLKLVPRLYSIASSYLTTPNEIHILLKYVTYNCDGKKRIGTTSNYLANIAKENVTGIEFYIHKSRHFFLPDTTKDIIMIGPGMGLAPFVSFLKERYYKKAIGRNWLFFLEKGIKTTFFISKIFYFNYKKKNF